MPPITSPSALEHTPPALTLKLLSYEAHADLIKKQFSALLDRLDEHYQKELSALQQNQRITQLLTKGAIPAEIASAENEAQTLLEGNQNDLEKRSLEATALSKDAFRNPKLSRSAQLGLALLSQQLSATYPPRFRELQDAYNVARDPSTTDPVRVAAYNEAIAEHVLILNDLRKLLDELRELDRQFEGANFINRLQSLSQALDLRTKALLNTYNSVVGITPTVLDPSYNQENTDFIRLQAKDSEALRWIEDDLRNYSSYSKNEAYLNLADNIQKSEAYPELKQSQDFLQKNQRYLATVTSSKWSAQIAAWAEELSTAIAGPEQTGGGGGGSGGSPQEQDAEFMFRIMEIVREQQNLRGKTRALEQNKRQQSQ